MTTEIENLLKNMDKLMDEGFTMIKSTSKVDFFIVRNSCIYKNCLTYTSFMDYLEKLEKKYNTSIIKDFSNRLWRKINNDELKIYSLIEIERIPVLKVKTIDPSFMTISDCYKRIQELSIIK